MPYGSYDDTYYLRTAHWAARYVPTDTSWPYDPELAKFGGYTSPPAEVKNKRFRSGNNATMFKSKDGKVLLPKVISVKTKTGSETIQRRRYRWIQSGDGSSRREYFIQTLVKPIYTKVPKVIYVPSRVLKPENVLIAPNHLNYVQSMASTDPIHSEVSFVYSNYPPHHTYRGIVNFFGMQLSAPIPVSPESPLFEDWGAGNGMSVYGSEAAALGYPCPIPYYDALPGLVSTEERDSCRNAVISALYKKVRSEFPDYAVTFAESGESLRTLRSIFKRGISLLLDLKRLDLKRLSGRAKGITAKSISQQWLEFVYGVSPIISDISDTMELFNREARTWRKYSTSKEVIVEALDDVARGSMKGRSKQVHRVQFRASVILDGVQFQKDLLKKSGFDTNQLDTVYELVPFSFMLDWLIDIGGYLGSSEVLSSGVLHYWETIVIDNELELDLKHYARGNYLSVIGPDLTHRLREFSVNRSVSETAPMMPPPSIDKLSDVFNVNRLLNAAAIFIARNPTLNKF